MPTALSEQRLGSGTIITWARRRSAVSRGRWRSQDSVETLSTWFVSRLELVRTQPAEMTVAARPIVEGIDAVGQVGDRQLAVLVDLFLDPLVLWAAEERLGEVEHDYIAATLRASGGNRAKAAEKLGIGAATLYRKLKQARP